MTATTNPLPTRPPEAPGSSPRGRRAGDRRPRPLKPRQFYRHVMLVGAAMVMFYPLAWLSSAAIRPDGQINDPGLVPQEFTLEHVATGWEGLAGVGFGRFLANSFLVASLAVVANLVACSLTAYALARIDFRFRKLAFVLMLGTLMLPYHVILIPQYIFFRELGWVDTYWPFIVPKALGTDAFFVYLLVQFFRAIPRDLDDAARIDGCGHGRIFFRIILPLSKPALATAAIFTFIYSWNDFFTPLIYLTSTEMYTVPLALRGFIDATGTSAFGALFAMSVVSLLPVLGIFIAFQRLLVEGIATTGMKG